MGSVKGGEYVGTVGGRGIGGWLVGRGGEVCTGFFHLSEVGRGKNSNFFQKNFFSATHIHLQTSPIMVRYQWAKNSLYKSRAWHGLEHMQRYMSGNSARLDKFSELNVYAQKPDIYRYIRSSRDRLGFYAKIGIFVAQFVGYIKVSYERVPNQKNVYIGSIRIFKLNQ